MLERTEKMMFNYLIHMNELDIGIMKHYQVIVFQDARLKTNMVEPTWDVYR